MLMANLLVVNTNTGVVDLNWKDEPVHNIKTIGDILKNYGFKNTYIPFDKLEKEYSAEVIEGDLCYVVTCYWMNSLFNNRYGK